MSLDLYQRETEDRLSTLPGIHVPEAGAFDGFIRGSAEYTMRGFAQTARAIDLAGSVGPIVQDAFTGGTEAQDRYFREHDEVFQSAVDYWTPKPNEVGVAGQIVGQLASLLPTVFFSPALAVGATQLSVGEELVKKDVPAGKAVAVGAIQGAGTGLGIWMPILGRNLWERVFVGGAGFNVAQGLAMRGASGVILEGTPADKDFQAFDGEALTLDVLLGMAFGSMTHLSPAQQAQGKQAWEKIGAWVERWRPSDVDAVATLRQAQHLNVDSVGGRPAGPEDIIAHVERMKTAIDQLARGKLVDVSDQPAPDVLPATPEELAAVRERFEVLQVEAERIRVEENFLLPEERSRRSEGDVAPARVVVEVEGVKGELGQLEGTARMAMRERLQEIVAEREAASPERIAELDEEVRTIREQLRKPVAELPPLDQPQGWEPTAEAAPTEQEISGSLRRMAIESGWAEVGGRIIRSGEGASAEEIAMGRGGESDPLAAAADRFVADNPDLEITVGQNADGTPITQRPADMLAQAREARARSEEDATLVRAAAQCLLWAA
jgi:hypothetical protein